MNTISGTASQLHRTLSHATAGYNLQNRACSGGAHPRRAGLNGRRIAVWLTTYWQCEGDRNVLGIIVIDELRAELCARGGGFDAQAKIGVCGFREEGLISD